MFVSLTRLRIRSIRFMPFFAFHALRSLRQVRKAPGFLKGELLPDRQRTYWTMTAWDNQENMRAYMISGSHKKAMTYLLEWCDEASVAHWIHPDGALPSWTDADTHMRQEGRPSKVRHPSSRHANLTYAVPRTTRKTAI